METRPSGVPRGVLASLLLLLLLPACGGPAEPGGPPDAPPAAPAGLRAVAGDARVDLSWDANGEADLARYGVYQEAVGGVAGAALERVAEVPAGTETYAAEGLTNGTTYRFALDAVDAAGNRSPRSAAVTATPAAPPDGPPDAACTPGPGTGTLDVRIAAPPGVTPAVHVVGVGVEELLDGSRALPLASGPYRVRVERVVAPPAPGALAGTALGEVDAALQEACVEPDATTTVDLAYEAQPAGGMLWVANDLGSRILGFTQDDLATPNGDPASVRLDLGFDDPKGLAFDDLGNLWVARFDPEAIVVLTPDQLAASGSPTPALVIESSALSAPWDVAFDPDGNLWVSDWQNHSLLMFARDALDELLLLGGEQARAPDRTLVTTELFQPEGLAFDADGNLWVGSSRTSGTPAGQNDRVMKFAAADLDAVAPAPALVVTAEGLPLIGASWPAFDADGNLWVTTGKHLAKIAAGELSGSGTAVVDFGRPGNFHSGTISLPQGLAFDAGGDLWLGDAETTLRRYTPTESNTGVAWSTSSDLRYPAGLAFYPSPLGGTLPLR